MKRSYFRKAVLVMTLITLLSPVTARAISVEKERCIPRSGFSSFVHDGGLTVTTSLLGALTGFLALKGYNDNGYNNTPAQIANGVNLGTQALLAAGRGEKNARIQSVLAASRGQASLFGASPPSAQRLRAVLGLALRAKGSIRTLLGRVPRFGSRQVSIPKSQLEQLESELDEAWKEYITGADQLTLRGGFTIAKPAERGEIAVKVANAENKIREIDFRINRLFDNAIADSRGGSMFIGNRSRFGSARFGSRRGRTRSFPAQPTL